MSTTITMQTHHTLALDVTPCLCPHRHPCVSQRLPAGKVSVRTQTREIRLFFLSQLKDKYLFYNVYCLLILFAVLPVYSTVGQPNVLPVNENRVVQETMLNDIQLSDFKELTEQKMNEFQRYLSVVADPKQQDNIRELAIENALLLFMPDATMQVGAIRTKTPVKVYPLPIYLRRLKNLDKTYVDINISFYDIALVGDWAPTTQGYGTTATYFQHFKAFDQKGHIVYGAKTAKQLTVDLRDRKDPFYDEHRWTVLLGDVRLTETRPKKPAH